MISFENKIKITKYLVMVGLLLWLIRKIYIMFVFYSAEGLDVIDILIYSIVGVALVTCPWWLRVLKKEIDKNSK